jgi:type IVB pilus formation R64 PilN family outer membrane protein
MTRPARPLGAILLLFALGAHGCGLASDVEERIDRMSEEAVAKTARPVSRDRPMHVVIDESDQPYFGRRTITSTGAPLPPDLEGERGIATNIGTPMSIRDWAQHITEIARLPVRVVDETVGTRLASADPSGSAEGLSLSYSGSLSALLDLVCDHFGARWRYDQGTVTIQAGVMRSFTIAAPQSLIEATGGDSGSGDSTSSSDSGSSGSLNLKEADPWEDVTGNIEVLRGNANVFVSAKTGTVTAWGPPADVDRIARYVEVLNDIYSRQVVLTVQLVSFSFDRRENYGFDLAPVFRDAGLQVALSGATIPGESTTAGSISASVIDPGSNSALQSWDESSAVLQALNEHGRASVENRATLVTPHGRPVEFLDLNVEEHVTGSQTALVTNAGSQTTITSSAIEAGTKIVAVPWITDSGLIRLELGLSIQETPSFRSVGDETNLVELASYRARRSHQMLSVTSGATVLLTGFEGASASSRKRGQAPGGFPLWGGGSDASNTETRFLVLVNVRSVGARND